MIKKSLILLSIFLSDCCSKAMENKESTDTIIINDDDINFESISKFENTQKIIYSRNFPRYTTECAIFDKTNKSFTFKKTAHFPTVKIFYPQNHQEEFERLEQLYLTEKKLEPPVEKSKQKKEWVPVSKK